MCPLCFVLKQRSINLMTDSNSNSLFTFKRNPRRRKLYRGQVKKRHKKRWSSSTWRCSTDGLESASWLLPDNDSHWWVRKLVCTSRKRGGVNSGNTCWHAKGKQGKDQCTFIWKGWKSGAGKGKAVHPWSKTAHSGRCMLVIAKLKFIISVTVGDKLARIWSKERERQGQRKNWFGIFTLNKGKGKEQSAVKRKSCGNKMTDVNQSVCWLVVD